MERKTWTIDLDGTSHEVVLHWTYWGGKRTVELDGRQVDNSAVPMRGQSEQRFEIDGHPAVVRTRPSMTISPLFVITLEVDGREIEPHSGRSFWESRKQRTAA